MTQELVLTFIGIAVAGYGLYELVHYLIHHHYDEHRMRDMVFLQVRVPRKESKEDVEKETQAYSAQKSFKEIIGIMTHFFESLHSMYDKSWRYHWIGQDYLSLEYAVIDGEIHFYMVVPRDLMVFWKTDYEFLSGLPYRKGHGLQYFQTEFAGLWLLYRA